MTRDLTHPSCYLYRWPWYHIYVHVVASSSRSFHNFTYESLLQLYSKKLEKTMARFVEGEIKILLSTNIVESGLDIQNANTIIIQDFQQFGLAQLYQVRCWPLLHAKTYDVAFEYQIYLPLFFAVRKNQRFAFISHHKSM